MLDTQDLRTSRQDAEQVSSTILDTDSNAIDESTLALAAELEPDMEEPTNPEQETSESGDASSQSDEDTMTTTEQVVEQVVTTKEVNRGSLSPPQWTPVNPGPRPTTAGKGVKQVGGDVVNNETDKVIVGDTTSSDTASSESSEDEQPKPCELPGAKALSTNVPDASADESSDAGNEQGDEAPSSDAAAEDNTTPSSPQDDEQTTDHPTTDGKGPKTPAPLKLETLKTATAERMKSHLASAGLNTKGTKDQLMVRILLSDNGLDLDTYSLRCSILLGSMWNLKQLKDRCEELGVPKADRKTSSKTKLAQHLLLAEKDQGIFIADDDNQPKTSAWSPPEKNKAPKPALKRKHDDSANATEDESPDAKRAKYDPDGRGDGASSPGGSALRPKKAPRKRPAKKQTVAPEDNETSESGTTPQVAPSMTAQSKTKRKRTGDDEADPDSQTSSKRPKKNDSSILAAAASKKAPTAQLVKAALKDKKLKKICEDNISFNDAFYSQDLFENQPVPVGVVQSALHVLTGCANDGDAATVFQHRSTLPNYIAYCQQDIDNRTDEDEVWLASQRYYEAYEMEAVRAEIGDDFSEDWDPSKNTDGVSIRDYYKLLKEPESDEFLSKEQKTEKRRMEMLAFKTRHVEVADPTFKMHRGCKQF